MFYDLTGKPRYKLGLHIHTTLSDGRKTPAEAAAIYREAGYDAIAVTDHWHYFPGERAEGITLISGCEYNLGATDAALPGMHITGIGMTRDPGVLPDPAPTFQSVVDAIHRAGGLAVLAHPAWSMVQVETALGITGFDATEIYNTVSGVAQSDRPDSGCFVDLLANRGRYLPFLATDDVHYYTDDQTTSSVLVAASDDSPEALLAALRKGDFWCATDRAIGGAFPPDRRTPELHVTLSGETVEVRCSPAEKIAFLSNVVWCPDRVLRDPAGSLTEGRYRLKPNDRYVRVETTDRFGRRAWSNILVSPFFEQ